MFSTERHKQHLDGLKKLNDALTKEAKRLALNIPPIAYMQGDMAEVRSVIFSHVTKLMRKRLSEAASLGSGLLKEKSSAKPAAVV
jgi:hypothetical protein